MKRQFKSKRKPLPSKKTNKLTDLIALKWISSLTSLIGMLSRKNFIRNDGAES